MRKWFEKEVRERIAIAEKPDILTENDLTHLPEIVKKYLIVSGVIGKEKVKNFKVKCEGKFRFSQEGGWVNITSEQYNFIDNPARIFYIKAKKLGIPITGLHIYKNVTARMIIKLAGIFRVADAKGVEMNQSETVTLFNDLCLVAPAALISKFISWESVDDLSVKAYFTNGDITISAILKFNEKGELINFISNDRYDYSASEKKYRLYPWSTPLTDFRKVNGIKVNTKADVIFHRPGKDFCYGKFGIKEIEYNVKGFS